MASVILDRWGCYAAATVGVVQDQHVAPIDDVIAHDFMRACWCQPIVEVLPCGCHASVIHRSADGREYNEPPNPKYPPATRH